MTLNGATPAGSLPAGSGRLSYYYFDNPATGAATFSATTTAASQLNCAYSIWELAGVDLTAPVATSTPAPFLNGNTTITTSAANSFIMDVLTVNNGGDPSVPDGNSVLTKLGDIDMNSGSGGGYMAFGSATEATAGTYNLGWTQDSSLSGGNLGSYVGESAFGFAPFGVPEPSTLALGVFSGLGFLLALSRRTK